MNDFIQTQLVKHCRPIDDFFNLTKSINLYKLKKGKKKEKFKLNS